MVFTKYYYIIILGVIYLEDYNSLIINNGNYFNENKVELYRIIKYNYILENCWDLWL